MTIDLHDKGNISLEEKPAIKENFNALCVGVGGTGVIRASIILGWAALKEGYKVRTAETHGMSQRGGSVSSYLRFGSTLESPFMIEGDLDVLLAFEISEAVRNLHFANKDTYIIASKNKVIPPSVLTHKTLKIDSNKCIGCGNCISNCFINMVYNAPIENHPYTLIKGPARKVVNGYSRVLESCTGCLHCIIDKVCPFGAISAFNEWEYVDVELIEKDIHSIFKNAIILDANEIALRAGNILTTNVVLLGVLTGINVLPIKKRTLKETILEFIPKKALSVNEKAFDLGCEIGEKKRKELNN
ncbi:MAG: 2-oxoacid:acceptor oxidoreductase family protein [Promethearchaeota archaeon]